MTLFLTIVFGSNNIAPVFCLLQQIQISHRGQQQAGQGRVGATLPPSCHPSLSSLCSKHAEALAKYKATIEAELCGNCDRVIRAINEKVLAKECDGEPKAFFVKMIGDYYRYIAENAADSKLEEAKNSALKAYDEANAISL